MACTLNILNLKQTKALNNVRGGKNHHLTLSTRIKHSSINTIWSSRFVLCITQVSKPKKHATFFEKKGRPKKPFCSSCEYDLVMRQASAKGSPVNYFS